MKWKLNYFKSMCKMWLQTMKYKRCRCVLPWGSCYGMGEGFGQQEQIQWKQCAHASSNTTHYLRHKQWHRELTFVIRLSEKREGRFENGNRGSEKEFLASHVIWTAQARMVTRRIWGRRGEVHSGIKNCAVGHGGSQESAIGWLW